MSEATHDWRRLLLGIELATLGTMVVVLAIVQAVRLQHPWWDGPWDTAWFTWVWFYLMHRGWWTYWDNRSLWSSPSVLTHILLAVAISRLVPSGGPGLLVLGALQAVVVLTWAGQERRRRES